jgi:hypothetical protein
MLSYIHAAWICPISFAWFAMEEVTYVVCALLFAGDVGMAWKISKSKCTFENQGVSLHSERAEKVRFLDFLGS